MDKLLDIFIACGTAAVVLVVLFGFAGAGISFHNKLHQKENQMVTHREYLRLQEQNKELEKRVSELEAALKAATAPSGIDGPVEEPEPLELKTFDAEQDDQDISG